MLKSRKWGMPIGQTQFCVTFTDHLLFISFITTNRIYFTTTQRMNQCEREIRAIRKVLLAILVAFERVCGHLPLPNRMQIYSSLYIDAITTKITISVYFILLIPIIILKLIP